MDSPPRAPTLRGGKNRRDFWRDRCHRMRSRPADRRDKRDNGSRSAIGCPGRPGCPGFPCRFRKGRDVPIRLLGDVRKPVATHLLPIVRAPLTRSDAVGAQPASHPRCRKRSSEDVIPVGLVVLVESGKQRCSRQDRWVSTDRKDRTYIPEETERSDCSCQSSVRSEVIEHAASSERRNHSSPATRAMAIRGSHVSAARSSIDANGPPLSNRTSRPSIGTEPFAANSCPHAPSSSPTLVASTRTSRCRSRSTFSSRRLRSSAITTERSASVSGKSPSRQRPSGRTLGRLASHFRGRYSEEQSPRPRSRHSGSRAVPHARRVPLDQRVRRPRPAAEWAPRSRRCERPKPRTA